MIVTCGGCETRYKLGDAKVPSKGIRVRCPKCRFVWRLTRSRPEPVFEVSSSGFDTEAPMAEAHSEGWNAPPQAASAVMSHPAMDTMESEIEISAPERDVHEAPNVEVTPEMKKKRERAKRLARVFVSDILVYNQAKRDKALKDGNLMTVLGPEIKKSWEAFKEKTGSDVVESNDYFREALNEILAGGQKIF